jgi:hypothetical protein
MDASRLVLGDADVPHATVVEAATEMVSRFLFTDMQAG